ncbi:ATOZI1 [Zea mays]|uniref:ATOZI1 n=1 Tax=Zea mays TaxID=4577 RepID=A0A1D6LJT8_MAIZE|nr:ATOZI1 [Zea mays]AQK79997.1 ATOZI1 [Zea mays]
MCRVLPSWGRGNQTTRSVRIRPIGARRGHPELHLACLR